MIRVFLGYDAREAAAYHVCCESIIAHASEPVAFHPLAKNLLQFDRDGSNAFTLSRYLAPSLCDYQGWAIYLDGDMVVDVDIAGLWAWQNTHKDKAIAVVPHDYKTRSPRKYIGTPMESANLDYPKKNQSSVVLWNCAHPANRLLDSEFVRAAPPSFLHRFEWLRDEDVGALSEDWNHLVGEFGPSSAHIYHYTLGVPGIKHYANDHSSWKWHETLLKALRAPGQDPLDMVKRAQERVGAV